MKQLKIKNVDIRVKEINGRDYISLTDIAKLKNVKRPSEVIRHWLSNKSSMLYIAEWEKINNPNFNRVKLDLIKKSNVVESDYIKSSNRAEPRPIEKSNSAESRAIKNSNYIGIIGGSGKYSEGTFADIDIALEFTRSISPIFALYVNTEFIRLKKAEQNVIAWNPIEDIKKIPLGVDTVTVKYKKVK